MRGEFLMGSVGGRGSRVPLARAGRSSRRRRHSRFVFVSFSFLHPVVRPVVMHQFLPTRQISYTNFCVHGSGRTSRVAYVVVFV